MIFTSGNFHMYLILIKNFVLKNVSLFLSIIESKMIEIKHKGFKKADYGKKTSLKTIGHLK
jgi:hypothetical protein